MGKITSDSKVTLRLVTAETLDTILGLKVREDQTQFIATNAKSIAQAHFHQEAWFRAIYADEVPVGFVMLYDEGLRDHSPENPTYFLWRFMIDKRFQGSGFGRQAMGLLINQVRSRPQAQELLLSYRQGVGSPEGFYRSLGFVHTGEEHEGEIEMRLSLQ
jgi:diamine N-acetyltransferase